MSGIEAAANECQKPPRNFERKRSKSLLPHFGLQNCRSQAEASIKHKVLCRSFAKGISDKEQNVERLAFVQPVTFTDLMYPLRIVIAQGDRMTTMKNLTILTLRKQ